MMFEMNSKLIVFLAVWVLAAIGHGAKLPREIDALEDHVYGLDARGDNLNLYDVNDVAFIDKFNQPFARADIRTTTVTVEICSAAPGTTWQAGTTTGTSSEASTSSVPVIPVSIPVPTSSISSSSGYNATGDEPIPPHSSVESISSSTASGYATSSTSEASLISAAITSDAPSGVSTTQISTSSTHSSSPFPSGTKVPNGAPHGGEEMTSAMLAMAVAIIALVNL